MIIKYIHPKRLRRFGSTRANSALCAMLAMTLAGCTSSDPEIAGELRLDPDSIKPNCRAAEVQDKRLIQSALEHFQREAPSVTVLKVGVLQECNSEFYDYLLALSADDHHTKFPLIWSVRVKVVGAGLEMDIWRPE